MTSTGTAKKRADHRSSPSKKSGGETGGAAATTTTQEQQQRRRPRLEFLREKMESNEPLTIVSALMADYCACPGIAAMRQQQHRAGEQRKKGGGGSSHSQFVELGGIQMIGLGAVTDELTPRERVYDTLCLLRARTERLISVGYLSTATVADDDGKGGGGGGGGPRRRRAAAARVAESVPLDVWNRQFPEGGGRRATTRHVQRIIDLVKRQDYITLETELAKELERQKAHPARGDNLYLSGITAHSLAVVKVLSGKDREAEPLFREAIALKEKAFGCDHHETALSWDELGIQLFSESDFDGALAAFRAAQRQRRGMDGGEARHPAVAMHLNNIACCYFQLGQYETALLALEESRDVQHGAVGSSAQADLDLLHVAITYCNTGYLKLALKQYEEARSILEEALLIQQSVLDDDHRAIRDTLSNLEFANAFHS